MRKAVFMQVRLSSTRLPRKAVLSFHGKTTIEHAMDSLRRVPVDVHALLTDEASLPELKPFASRYGFQCFAGDPDDVLARYSTAASHFEIDRFFRATGDNPLVSWRLAMALEEKHEAHCADFSGFLGPPLGTGVELVEARAIHEAAAEAEDPYEREHVCPFIYRRPERFRVFRPWADDDVLLPDVRVTLDTDADFEFLNHLYDELYHGEPIETVELVSWLRKHSDVRSRGSGHDAFPASKAG